MTIHLNKLLWYWRRLSGMTPAEGAHRLAEVGRRARDRRRPRPWEDFAAPVVNGLPGLDRDWAQTHLMPAAADVAARIGQGRLSFLGQDWPVLASGPWWRTPVWRLDPVTGRHWPGMDVFGPDTGYRHAPDMGDVKLVWELGRLQYLPALALDDPQAAFDLVAGWMEQNPPYRGIHWTGGIEAAIRLVSVLAAMGLGMKPPPGDPRLGRFVAAHAQWIARYPSLYSSANNHRVAELTGLFLAGACAPALARDCPAVAQARQGLEREMALQFHADGVGKEQSPTYAAYSLEWFALAGIAADAVGAPFPAAFRAQARSAAKALLAFADEGGALPRIGDDDESRVLTLGLVREEKYPLSVAALVTRWLEKAEPAYARAPSLRDALCPPRAFPHLSHPPAGDTVFRDGGYTVMRRAGGDGQRMAILDHGPLGYLAIAAHGHADALSLWLHWGDETVFADAGTYLYHAGREKRDWYRGTQAHNTLALGGQDQSPITGPFNWGRAAMARLTGADDGGVEAEHDGYLRRFGLVHRRRLAFEGHALILEDHLLGSPKRPGLRWSSGLTLAPGATVRLHPGGAAVTTAKGRMLDLQAERGGALLLEPTPFSPAFNREIVSSRLVLRGELGAQEPGCVSRILMRLP